MFPLSSYFHLRAVSKSLFRGLACRKRGGDIFGELALLYNAPRAASVTSKVHSLYTISFLPLRRVLSWFQVVWMRYIFSMWFLICCMIIIHWWWGAWRIFSVRRLDLLDHFGRLFHDNLAVLSAVSPAHVREIAQLTQRNWRVLLEIRPRACFGGSTVRPSARSLPRPRRSTAGRWRNSWPRPRVACDFAAAVFYWDWGAGVLTGRDIRTLIYCICTSTSGEWENIRMLPVRARSPLYRSRLLQVNISTYSA